MLSGDRRETDQVGWSREGLEGVGKKVTVSVTRGKTKQQAIASELQRGEHGGDKVVGWYSSDQCAGVKEE